MYRIQIINTYLLMYIYITESVIIIHQVKEQLFSLSYIYNHLNIILYINYNFQLVMYIYSYNA